MRWPSGDIRRMALPTRLLVVAREWLFFKMTDSAQPADLWLQKMMKRVHFKSTLRADTLLRAPVPTAPEGLSRLSGAIIRTELPIPLLVARELLLFSRGGMGPRALAMLQK